MLFKSDGIWPHINERKKDDVDLETKSYDYTISPSYRKKALIIPELPLLVNEAFFPLHNFWEMDITNLISSTNQSFIWKFTFCTNGII